MKFRMFLFLLMAFVIGGLGLSLGGGPKLVFVEYYQRHGHKYPDLSLSKQINQRYQKEQIPLSQLTNVGRAVTYLTGKKMFEVYWKQIFHENPNQINPSKILVKSTEIPRTIESASSHILGLLQSLPPLTLSQKQAELMMPAYPGIKAKAGYVLGTKGNFSHTLPINILQECLFSQYIYRKPLISLNFQSSLSLQIQKYPPFQKAYRLFRKSLALPQGQCAFADLHRFYLNEIDEMHLGKESILSNQSSEIVRTLKALDSMVLMVRYYTNELQMSVDASPWFRQLIANMQNYTANPDSVRWVFISIHEVQMGIILAAMKMWTPECIWENYQKNITEVKDCITEFPPFGSILAFEMYEYANKTHTFKVRYNGKHLSLPFCSNSKECLVSVLQNWFETWRVPENREGCHTSDQQITRKTVFSSQGLILK